MKLIAILALLAAPLFAQEDRPVRYFPTDPAGGNGGACSVITPFWNNWAVGHVFECVGASGTNHGTWRLINNGGGQALPLANTCPAPPWSGTYLIYDCWSVNLGAYPVTSQFGMNTVPFPEAIAGLMNIPSNAIGDLAGVGVSGYAITSSPHMNSVGVMGFAGLRPGGVNAAGINAIATNCNAPQCVTETGAENAIILGQETDLNIFKVPGGSNPNVGLYGLYIAGTSEATPNFSKFAVYVDSFGVGQSPPLRWDSAFRTVDGVANSALDVGTAFVGNNTGSQSISLRSRDAGGVNRNALILTDAIADLILRPGATSGILLDDSSGNNALTIVPSGSTPNVLITNSLGVGGLAGSGHRPVCTDAFGNIYAGTNIATVLACP